MKELVLHTSRAKAGTRARRETTAIAAAGLIGGMCALGLMALAVATSAAIAAICCTRTRVTITDQAFIAAGATRTGRCPWKDVSHLTFETDQMAVGIRCEGDPTMPIVQLTPENAIELARHAQLHTTVVWT